MPHCFWFLASSDFHKRSRSVIERNPSRRRGNRLIRTCAPLVGDNANVDSHTHHQSPPPPLPRWCHLLGPLFAWGFVWLGLRPGLTQASDQNHPLCLDKEKPRGRGNPYPPVKRLNTLVPSVFCLKSTPQDSKTRTDGFCVLVNLCPNNYNSICHSWKEVGIENKMKKQSVNAK